MLNLSLPKGDLVFIERVRVSGAAVTTLAFSTLLDGNADGTYYMTGWFTNPAAGNAIYSWEPNSISANQFTIRSAFTNNTARVQATSTTLRFAISISGTDAMFWSTFYARATDGTTARNRYFESRAISVNTAGSSLNAGEQYGQWNDSTTNVTSLRVNSSVAGSIGIGSEMSIWKLLDH